MATETCVHIGTCSIVVVIAVVVVVVIVVVVVVAVVDVVVVVVVGVGVAVAVAVYDFVHIKDIVCGGYDTYYLVGKVFIECK